MKPVKKPLMALFVALFISGVVGATGIKFEKLTLKQGLEKAKKENKKFFIDVYATWCGPCKYLDKSVFTDQDLGDFMNENFVCLKLDGELADGESLMIEFNLNSYPTMLFLSPERALEKKIVGAVSASEIQRVGTNVLNPESTEIYKLKKRYDSGDRDRTFMLEYIKETISEEIDAVPLAISFLEHHPKLSLENEDDFLIFYLTSDDLSDKNVSKFLGSIDKYNGLHEEYSSRKVMAIIGQLMDDSLENGDSEIFKDGIDIVYEAYALVQNEDAYSKTELLDVMQNYFDENVEE
ncbi:MAG: thioredoxin family protein [Crocinitomicaceae bacterium]|jgi:thiol-disulfide isomerase/thioredoxin|tara:strand:- start:17600 stop:18481 length:882 start_codon:yes stop_codon:yes gene_type:complete